MNALIAYLKAEPVAMVIVLIGAAFLFLALGLALTLLLTRGES